MEAQSWETDTLGTIGCTLCEDNHDGTYHVCYYGGDVNIPIDDSSNSPEYQAMQYILKNTGEDDDNKHTIHTAELMSSMGTHTIQSYIDARGGTFGNIVQETKKFMDGGKKWISCLQSGVYINSVLFDFIDSLDILDDGWYGGLEHDDWYSIKNVKPNKLSKEKISVLQYLRDDFDNHERFTIIQGMIHHKENVGFWLAVSSMPDSIKEKFVDVYHSNHDISILNIHGSMENTMLYDPDGEFLLHQWSIYEQCGFDDTAYMDYMVHHNMMIAQQIKIELIDCMMHVDNKETRRMYLNNNEVFDVYIDYREITDDVLKGTKIFHDIIINHCHDKSNHDLFQRLLSLIYDMSSNSAPVLRPFAKSMIIAHDKGISDNTIINMLTELNNSDEYRLRSYFHDMNYHLVQEFARWVESEYYDTPYEFYHQISMMNDETRQ